VVLDDYRNLWFVDLLAGLHDQLSPLGFRVAVADPSFNARLDRTPVDGLMSLRVDGIVIATEPTEEMFAAVDVPAVVAGNRDMAIPGADVVANDDMMGGHLATESGMLPETAAQHACVPRGTTPPCGNAGCGHTSPGARGLPPSLTVTRRR
jgi:hypothetical protein